MNYIKLYYNLKHDNILKDLTDKYCELLKPTEYTYEDIINKKDLIWMKFAEKESKKLLKNIRRINWIKRKREIKTNVAAEFNELYDKLMRNWTLDKIYK